MELLLSLLVLGAGLSWGLGVLHVEGLRRKGRYVLRPGSAGPVRPARVSILIPARDEERNIEGCVRAALAQEHEELEVVVVDDDSQDRTGEILAALREEFPDRLRVLGGRFPPPDGWLGKPWACQRAGEAATGDWLLFIDADVRLHPRALPAALGWAQDHGLALLSGLGTMEMESAWEKILQPAVGAIIMLGNDLERINDPTRRDDRPLANGQFLLFRREAWLGVGGHAAVARAVLDDVGMATAVVGRGGAYELLMMRELFRCRMYDSLGSLWEGWSKNLFIGIRRRVSLLLFLTGWIFTGSVLPFLVPPLAVLGLLSPLGGALGLLVALVILRLRWWLDRTYGGDVRFGPTLPLASLMLIGLFWASAIRTWTGRVRWKGRRLDLGAAEGL